MHHHTAPEPLPLHWIEKLFRKLSARYGRAFLGQYDGVALEDVMADWAEELGGFGARPEALAHAIAHLPERAPNVAQFRALCVGAPSAAPALPPVPADPARVQAELAKVNRAAQPTGRYTDWIARGLSDIEAGIKRSPTVIRMIRAAAASKGVAA